MTVFSHHEAAPTPVVEPALSPLLRWVASPQVVSADGVVRSWWNPGATGYSYPEAAGLWLSLVTGEPQADRFAPRALTDAVAAWLCGEILARGAAGRHDRLYVFDSGIALSGLVAYARSGGSVDVAPAATALLQFVERGTSTRVPVHPKASGAQSHWSNAFGAHLLKVAIALHRWADLTGDHAPREVACAISEHALRLYDGRRFVVSDGADLSYLHATLYGFEGLAWLNARGVERHEGALETASELAASLQRPDGGIPPFWDGRSAHGEPRADVAAQAVRLWLLHDPTRWAPEVGRALAFLASLQTAEGGVLYHAGSGDVNTWSSLFAAQALLWTRSGAVADRLF